ncbi:arsenate reductase ArsC [Hydrogenimonas urashimensis]|uniref:arsenate reductase ArsC n=1 Tax=Hydrogenimonas urashimensis TaxID=2740515 RepID=UPI0019167A52|nr:arsenate reductase ArsC [Hydrogenimonas urashimensis]
MKKVLIIDNGNAARSIMAQALVNRYLGRPCDVHAESAGLAPKGSIDHETLQVLAEDGIETEHLWSKSVDDLKETDYDLVVTVCDNVKEVCPTFPGAKKEIHIGFDDPSGKPFEAYERELHQMKNLLIPRIREELCEE